MRDILEEIVANKREEIAQFHQLLPITTLATLTEKMLHITVPSMRRALMGSTTGIIAEFKRRSPSRGWIHRDARVSEVVPAYEQSGASAVSILTDRSYFGGYDEHIQQARFMGVSLPILYKNFVVDEYQLFQARYCGASAVLLIASVLTIDECRRLMSLAHQLGLEVLLESTPRANSTMLPSSPTCMASTTATSAPSPPMSTPASIWQSVCPMMPAR